MRLPLALERTATRRSSKWLFSFPLDNRTPPVSSEPAWAAWSRTPESGHPRALPIQTVSEVLDVDYFCMGGRHRDSRRESLASATLGKEHPEVTLAGRGECYHPWGSYVQKERK